MTPSLNVSGSDEALLSDEELLAINNDAPCSSGLPNRAYTSEGFSTGNVVTYSAPPGSPSAPVVTFPNPVTSGHCASWACLY